MLAQRYSVLLEMYVVNCTFNVQSLLGRSLPRSDDNYDVENSGTSTKNPKKILKDVTIVFLSTVIRCVRKRKLLRTGV